MRLHRSTSPVTSRQPGRADPRRPRSVFRRMPVVVDFHPAIRDARFVMADLHRFVLRLPRRQYLQPIPRAPKYPFPNPDGNPSIRRGVCTTSTDSSAPRRPPDPVDGEPLLCLRLALSMRQAYRVGLDPSVRNARIVAASIQRSPARRCSQAPTWTPSRCSWRSAASRPGSWSGRARRSSSACRGGRGGCPRQPSAGSRPRTCPCPANHRAGRPPLRQPR